MADFSAENAAYARERFTGLMSEESIDIATGLKEPEDMTYGVPVRAGAVMGGDTGNATGAKVKPKQQEIPAKFKREVYLSENQKPAVTPEP